MQRFEVPVEYADTLVGNAVLKGVYSKNDGWLSIRYEFVQDGFIEIRTIRSDVENNYLWIYIGIEIIDLAIFIHIERYGTTHDQLLEFMRRELIFEAEMDKANIDRSNLEYNILYLTFKLEFIIRRPLGYSSTFIGELLFYRVPKTMLNTSGFENIFKIIIDGYGFLTINSRYPIGDLVLTESYSDAESVLQEIFQRLRDRHYDCPEIYAGIARKMIKRAS